LHRALSVKAIRNATEDRMNGRSFDGVQRRRAMKVNGLSLRHSYILEHGYICVISC
jgi:hypothetical protein